MIVPHDVQTKDLSLLLTNSSNFTKLDTYAQGSFSNQEDIQSL